MSDDPMFDYILARSRTRESSILTVATIASSASLVLLALYLQAQSGTCISCISDSMIKSEFWIIYFGMVFPTVGILYRELTKATIHDNDECWLRQYIIDQQNDRKRDLIDKKHRVITDPLCYCEPKRLREGLIRTLLVIPIIAWILIVNTIHEELWFIPCATIAILAVSGFYVIFLSSRERKD